jgi:hypothetical protein
MTSNLHAFWDTLLPFLRPVLPYPDLRRRRRIRCEAHKLTELPAWPGNDAEPIDVARLAMLRLLYLQKEAHKAVRWRQREAAALLARSSVETCIKGLYYLYSDDSVERLRRDTRKSLGQILTPIADPHLLTGDLILAMSESVTGSIEPGQQLPDLNQIAQAVASVSMKPAATILYDQAYRPLSTLFAHSRGLALLRHVGPDGKLLDHPEFPWLRRSAARISDACVGVLAEAVAHSQSSPADTFGSYADDHWRRVMHPFTAMGSKGMLQSTDWRKIPKVWVIIKEIRRYYNSEQAQHDPAELVEARIREAYETALRTLNPNFSQAELDLLMEHIAPQLTSAVISLRDEKVDDMSSPDDQQTSEDGNR